MYWRWVLVAAAAAVAASSTNAHIYDIVALDERFRCPDSYQWRSFDQSNSGGKMYPYGAIRVDNVTLMWNLSNNSEVNTLLKDMCTTSVHQCPVFMPVTFLSTLRNKKLGVLGDSLSLQLFHGLHNSLTPYISHYLNSSGHEVQPSSEGFKTMHAVVSAEYNVTIYFCYDVYLLLVPYIQRDAKCMPTFLSNTDIFVFGVAAWYKPKHRPEHRSPDISYNHSYNYNVIALEKQLRDSRLKINATFPAAKVIWRNQPHAGRMDEWIMLHSVKQDEVVSHFNGLLWSNVSLGAHWVPVYNDIISRQAAVFGDPVLDWYTLSLQYIDYFNGLTPRLAAHSDSLHYYGDGLPRGGALLLQDALKDLK